MLHNFFNLVKDIYWKQVKHGTKRVAESEVDDEDFKSAKKMPTPKSTDDQNKQNWTGCASEQEDFLKINPGITVNLEDFRCVLFYIYHILRTSIKKWMFCCFTFSFLVLVYGLGRRNVDNHYVCKIIWSLAWTVYFGDVYDKNRLWQCSIYKQNLSIFSQKMCCIKLL